VAFVLLSFAVAIVSIFRGFSFFGLHADVNVDFSCRSLFVDVEKLEQGA